MYKRQVINGADAQRDQAICNSYGIRTIESKNQKMCIRDRSCPITSEKISGLWALYNAVYTGIPPLKSCSFMMRLCSETICNWSEFGLSANRLNVHISF